MAGPHAKRRMTSRWSFQATEPAPGCAAGELQRGILNGTPVIVGSTLRESRAFVDILSLNRGRHPLSVAPLGDGFCRRQRPRGKASTPSATTWPGSLSL